MMTIQRRQESEVRSQESELCRVVIETILCCLLGVLFGVAMYWGWAREFAQSELAGPLTDARIINAPSGTFPR